MARDHTTYSKCLGTYLPNVNHILVKIDSRNDWNHKTVWTRERKSYHTQYAELADIFSIRIKFFCSVTLYHPSKTLAGHPY